MNSPFIPAGSGLDLAIVSLFLICDCFSFDNVIFFLQYKVNVFPLCVTIHIIVCCYEDSTLLIYLASIPDRNQLLKNFPTKDSWVVDQHLCE